MSQSGGSSHPNLHKIDSFSERVENLLDELDLSIRADRPSILLAPYASEFVREEVEFLLEKQLKELGQELIRFTAGEEQFDIPLRLSRRPDRRVSVYSIGGLSLGGGKAGANAYRALNMRRELLVDFHIRSIFWLAAAEARELSRHAPDFWAFRHRVVEFNRPADINHLELSGGETPLKSVRAARKAVRLSPGEITSWLSLGNLYLELGLLPQARQAFLRLLALNSRNPSGWFGLGQVCRLGKQTADAIINYQQVIGLNPRNIQARIALIACYRLLGQAPLASEQMQWVQPVLEDGNEFDQAAFASVCGNVSQAVKWLAFALEKHQVDVNKIRHDPNLDFIRTDPGFVQLLASPVTGEVRDEAD